jgi:hypothetical protein
MKKEKIIYHRDFNFFLSNEFETIGTKNDYIYEDLFINYKKLCSPKVIYKNTSFQINDKNISIYCPATLEVKLREIELNYFGEPFSILSTNFLQSEHKKRLTDIFHKLKDKNSFKNFLLKSPIPDEEINLKLEQDDTAIDSIHTECKINLKQTLNQILSSFSKGHKSSLKKNYPELVYELFDHTNYQDNQILEMMKLHEVVSKQKSRSTDTWIAMEKMIINKSGFLVRVKNKDKLISYAFFFHNKYNSYYFSSCTIRDNFKKYNNITHKTIWKALEYLKKIKCSYLFLGITKTINKYSKNWISKLYNLTDEEALKFHEKENMVHRFKASFGGEKNNFVVYKDIPKNF